MCTPHIQQKECVHICHPHLSSKTAGHMCAHSFIFSANKRGCNYVQSPLDSAKMGWKSKKFADSIATARRRRQSLQAMEARTFPRAGRCRKDAWCCRKCTCCHAPKTKRNPQTRQHKHAAKRQRRLCCLILLQTNPCAGLQ